MMYYWWSTVLTCCILCFTSEITIFWSKRQRGKERGQKGEESSRIEESKMVQRRESRCDINTKINIKIYWDRLRSLNLAFWAVCMNFKLMIFTCFMKELKFSRKYWRNKNSTLFRSLLEFRVFRNTKVGTWEYETVHRPLPPTPLLVLSFLLYPSFYKRRDRFR